MCALNCRAWESNLRCGNRRTAVLAFPRKRSFGGEIFEFVLTGTETREWGKTRTMAAISAQPRQTLNLDLAERSSTTRQARSRCPVTASNPRGLDSQHAGESNAQIARLRSFSQLLEVSGGQSDSSGNDTRRTTPPRLSQASVAPSKCGWVHRPPRRTRESAPPYS
jgi:hypothetical protein